MNILHLARVDIKGGAARATYRLHCGLREQGIQSRLLVREKRSTDPTVHCVTPEAQTVLPEVVRANAIQRQYIDGNRSALSNVPFSLPFPGLDVSQLPLVQAADIIHLHWVARFQSPATVKALLQLGKPVVWTLHDMWPFTGGCHSAATCTKYQQDCRDCEQLEQDPHDLTAGILQDKLDVLAATDAHPPLTVIAPSQKMAAQAQRSQLFQTLPTAVIHHAIDTDIFSPRPKLEAKRALGLPEQGRAIAFGAENCKQRSKGVAELVQVLQRCWQDEVFRALVKEDQLYLVCFGDFNPQVRALDIPVFDLGYIKSDTKLRNIYSAADVFLQPTLEESFGNMAIESLCCGTPVIGFDVGVAADAIDFDQTGRVVPLQDIDQMTAAVLDFAHHPHKWQQMQSLCRERTHARFSRQTQATQHIELYEEVLAASARERTPQSFSEFDTTSDEGMQAPWQTERGSGLGKIWKAIALDCLTQELIATQQENQRLRQTTRTTQQALNQTRSELADYRQKVEQHQTEIQDLNHHLGLANGEIEAMKTSKFWKIRTQWIALKQKLGLPVT